MDNRETLEQRQAREQRISKLVFDYGIARSEAESLAGLDPREISARMLERAGRHEFAAEYRRRNNLPAA